MKRFKITDLLIGVIFTLLFISIAVVITINFRPLYYMDINLLHIEAESGYNKAEIKENYDALIDYSSPFFKGDLQFPTMGASQNGLQHFAEVKNIFTSFYILGAIALICAVIIIVYKAKKKDYSYQLVSAVTAIVLPLLLGLYMSIDFNRAFLLFHKLFFKNNYWMFDPATDPVITILPEDFFMHCAILIIVIVLLFSAVFIGLYFWNKNHSGIKYRRNRGLKL
ncbi:MAG TPA: TIGR01906 family membrane protein [Mobilitalea sp.]|nr:TIGR01906 family membrane protein [Mobilitalea sp.]